MVGDDPSETEAAMTELLSACATNLAYWVRPGADINAGLQVFRLSPPRKFNWWFGPTTSTSWFVSAISQSRLFASGFEEGVDGPGN